jgi:DNA polymerase-3 subunit epsilon
MTLLKHQTFVCIDCETTGLDPKKDHIIEVAIATFTVDCLLEEFETLINPKVPIPKESIAVHHITEEMVQGKPSIEEALPQILKLAGELPIIGHGILFDIDILESHAKRHNIFCTLKNNIQFDTLRLARLYGRSPSNSLETLRQHFNIEAEGAHRAMSDVIVNIQVFKKLLSDFRTIEDLQKVLSKPIFMKNMPLGKHKGRPLKELPLNYLHWAANQDFDQDLLYSLRSELTRRKKGNSFAQAVNPFLSQL